MIIKFIADKMKISGPKVDGNISVTFDVGEYQRNEISELFKLSNDKLIFVEVTDDVK